MPTSIDLRTITGERVYTRARLLTFESKCRRLYGAVWKSKLINGSVIGVFKEKVKTRMVTFVEASWELSDGEKVFATRISKVKAGEHPNSNADGVTSGAHSQEAQNDVQRSEESNVTPGQGALIPSTRVSDSDITPASGPIMDCNGQEWTRQDVTMQINGFVKPQRWKVIGPVDETISEGHYPYDMTPLDYFMWMFTQSFLTSIVRYTNENMEKSGLRLATRGEIVKFLGALLLLTRCEFSDRRSLWSNTQPSKYLLPPRFGDIMSRNRFEELRKNIMFTSPSNKSDDPWIHVQEFIEAINEHRCSHVVPSEWICVDESMSRWYGLGGDWIGKSLPHYVAMKRKPENGCEIKSACCGKSGIMNRIEKVMSSSDTSSLDYESDNLHGTAVTLRLVEPWFESQRIVCGDAFFASVGTANELFCKSLRFIGVVKNATTGYPMKFLSHLELTGKGEHVTMVSKSEGGPDLMAVMWADRDRRYFVSSTGTTNSGSTILRERWRQSNDDARRLEISINIPEVCEKYYKVCSLIDRHNRCRQDDLNLEKKFQTKDWSMRINTSLLGMCAVDAWKLYCGSKGNENTMSPNQFYCQLADGLIDNTLDKITLRQRVSDSEEEDDDPNIGSGVEIHLTPTNRKRKRADGSETSACYQRRCGICDGRKKSKYICSMCKCILRKDVYICYHSTGRDCFKKHVDMCHDLSYK